MRDVYWREVTRHALADEKTVVVSADMSAPGLDTYRERLPHRYINVGIAEQDAILVATGLAMEGFNPIVYAIMPFITLRCYEQIKVVPALMKQKITIVGVGSGFGCDDFGPTHHALEDCGIMRLLPGVEIYNCSDEETARTAAGLTHSRDSGILYVRLDREQLPNIHTTEWIRDNSADSIAEHHSREKTRRLLTGTWNHKRGSRKIATTGRMTHTLTKLVAHSDAQLTEFIKFPIEELPYSNGDEIWVIDENNRAGCLAHALWDAAERRGISLRLHVRAIDVSDGYDYVYGGRENIHKHYGLDPEGLKQWLELD